MPQHGMTGPHYNLYRANQNPNNGRCFWQSIGAVPASGLPEDAIPIEPFSFLEAFEMKYPDGQQVRLGDVVALGTDQQGIVVCSIDTGEYSDAYPWSQWRYLDAGVLIEFPSYGLIHYKEPEPGLRLVAHASGLETSSNRGSGEPRG